MKTKKFLSLVLALVMALSLAVPAFAADPVVEGDVYQLDVSSETPAGSGDTSLALGGITATITDPDTSSNTTIATQLPEWVSNATATGWTISIDATVNTTLLFTATADGATPPTGATLKTAANTTIDDLADLEAGNDMTITGTTNVPTISVIVPNTGSVVCNPYKLSVTVKGTAYTDQIISAPQFIQNGSDVPLKVNIKGKATPSDTANISMATKAPTDKITDKQIYLFVNTKDCGTSAAKPASVEFDAFNKATSLVLGTADATLNGVNLPAKDATGNAFLAFRLEGAMTPAPATAWATSDTVEVALTFSFVASALATTTP